MGGQKGAAHKRVTVVMKLPQLQNLIKRDPSGYKEEFQQQHRCVCKQHLNVHSRDTIRVCIVIVLIN